MATKARVSVIPEAPAGRCWERERERAVVAAWVHVPSVASSGGSGRQAQWQAGCSAAVERVSEWGVHTCVRAGVAGRRHDTRADARVRRVSMHAWAAAPGGPTPTRRRTRSTPRGGGAGSVAVCGPPARRTWAHAASDEGEREACTSQEPTGPPPVSYSRTASSASRRAPRDGSSARCVWLACQVARLSLWRTLALWYMPCVVVVATAAGMQDTAAGVCAEYYCFPMHVHNSSSSSTRDVSRVRGANERNIGCTAAPGPPWSRKRAPRPAPAAKTRRAPVPPTARGAGAGPSHPIPWFHPIRAHLHDVSSSRRRSTGGLARRNAATQASAVGVEYLRARVRQQSLLRSIDYTVHTVRALPDTAAGFW